MKTSGHKILITGGATGIGLALAELLLKEGNQVLVCGRREHKLREAQRLNPGLLVKLCDISLEEDRQSLVEWAVEEHGINMLVNNAGMQRMIDLRQGLIALDAGDNEARINFEAPVYLTAMMLPHLLLAGKESAIINVSSGLGFVPLAIMPVYCATKAAMHSFTVSLRQQLKSTNISVFEVIPPMVDTDLDRGARAQRGQTDRGIPVEQAASEIMRGLQEDRYELTVGGAQNLIQGSRQNFDKIFSGMNR
jgi:uncharacterized oxidoreductase